MKILILKNGCKIAQDFGFGSAIRTLLKGLEAESFFYTLDEKDTFDVIVANDYESADDAVRLKKQTGKPLIASIHLSQDMEEEKELIKVCDGIIVYSKMMEEFIGFRYPSLSVPIEVCELGIDSDMWECGSDRENFVLFVGRTKAPNKNCIPFIGKCLEEKVSFKIAGDLDYVNADVNLGYLNGEELKKVYKKAGLLVLPSLFEPFGLVVLEAMACGCPVAVSTKAGVSELLSDEYAILFDPTKPYSVAEFLNTAKQFDQNKISNFALKLNQVSHARSFIGCLERILRKRSLSEISVEMDRGDYDVFPVKDKIVFDIGAFMGETACRFSKLGAKKVYAVEPFSSFDHIEATAREQGCDNIIPVRAAIGDKDDIVFIDDIVNSGETQIDKHIKTGGKEIKQVSLNTLLGAVVENDIVVKMDCEGLETAIFSATKDTLKKVKYFMIEAHENIHKEIGMAICLFLTENGFSARHIKHGENVGMVYAERQDLQPLKSGGG